MQMSQLDNLVMRSLHREVKDSQHNKARSLSSTTLFTCSFFQSYREVKDSQFAREKMSNKLAKELYQQFCDYEKKYKRMFSGKKWFDVEYQFWIQHWIS